MKPFAIFFTLLAAFASAGCATRTDSFDLSVRNDSAGPVTVWLTKSGGPEEQGWRSPESIAINYVVEDERLGGVIVPAGHTAETGKIKGKFAPDSYAVLRVYRGEMKMSEMLANGKDSPNRADTILRPGRTRVSVEEHDRKLRIVPLGSASSASAGTGRS